MMNHLKRGERHSNISESNKVGNSAKGLCFH